MRTFDNFVPAVQKWLLCGQRGTVGIHVLICFYHIILWFTVYSVITVNVIIVIIIFMLTGRLGHVTEMSVQYKL